MRRSVAFYRDVIGLPLRFESPGWTEFATESATLALHLSRQSDASVASSEPETPGRCRPGICVADLDEFHQRMTGHRVPCLQPPKEVFGSRVAQYADPDGVTISVGEEPRGR